jgi:hypothetical protein
MLESGNVEWHARHRDYARERKERRIVIEETLSHPLQEITVTMADTKVKRADSTSSSSSLSHGTATFSDPLSRMFEGKDPLSQFAAEVASPVSRTGAPSLHSAVKTATVGSAHDSTFEPWASKRLAILSRYTTTEKLSIVTILAPSADKRDSGQGTVMEKVKNRLEQLDDLEEGSVQETLNLSQQEYINRIEELNSSLIQAWEEDQRVKSLKIAIQCAKLLADICVIQFYPSKFVLITDILDTFGQLVYSRIAEKAGASIKGSGSRGFAENFTPDQVPESAKETCRNWFFKIASIRELIPRFYVEVAILRCYSFLTTGEYNQALVRLVSMVRGIGDPLVAAYSRCYLCRVGVLVAPTIRDHLMPCFDDLLTTFTSQAGTDTVQNALAIQRTDVPHYLVLYAPALDWILHCIAHGADDALLDSVFSRCATMPTGGALLLNSIMCSFRPDFIAEQALEFAQKIRDLDDAGFPRHLLYRSLGVCVAQADPPEDQRLVLLNEVWKAVAKLKNATEYIGCVDVWIEFVLKCFGRRELNTVLGDIIKHMMPDRAYEEHYQQLQSIMSKILLRRSTNFGDLFAHDKFMPFIDMFQKESVKVEVCKSIMEAYIREPHDTTSDPVITHALMRIARTMHDSVNAMSVDDEVRTIGSLIINGLIRTVSFGRDLEQQLAFLVECRAAFCNIDPVMQFLVHGVNKIAADVHRGSENAGGHTRRTGAFARACAAYAFITIPSLNGVFHRLSLYVESGHVALMNQCLSQADSFFRAAVSLIPTVPRFLDMDGKIRSTEPILVDFIHNFIATLLIVPDSPDQGTLYLLRGLLNVIQEYPWDANGDNKTMIYVKVLAMLAASVQEKLPYGVKRVDANDMLYGGDSQFVGEVERMAATLLREIGARLRELGSATDTLHRQSQLAFELFNRIIGHADLDNDMVFKTAVSLWTIVIQHGRIDAKLLARTVLYVNTKATRPGNAAYSRLAKELQCRVV